MGVAGGGKGDRAGVCHTQLSTTGETGRKAMSWERQKTMEVKAQIFKYVATN